MLNIGLILEGGGMRAVYTAGVLDFFMERELYFNHIYAVSAGSCQACSYLSKQQGRGYRTIVDYLDDKRYCSFYSLIKTGDLFGVEMCYDLIPNQLNLYDYEVFDQYEGNFYAVVTNCSTGKSEYIKINDMHRDIIAIRASSSLPLVSRNVAIGDQEYLDGGISDPIPLAKSLQDGNRKNVVILTQSEGYTKKADSTMPLLKLRYRKYPQLVKSMETRHMKYNETLLSIQEEEKKGNAFVIRPSLPPNIGRTEKNIKKLQDLYEMGYENAKASYKDLKNFITG
jgi:predicted patatin/cPLA2 family phospholipase